MEHLTVQCLHANYSTVLWHTSPWTLHQREDHNTDIQQLKQDFCISFSSLLIFQSQGKMKLYVFLLFVILVVGHSIRFNLELQKNILNFGYSINYKYEGMLTHSLDRFYIIVKFMLPSMGDLKFSNLNFDHSYAYMNKKYTPNTDFCSKYLADILQ